MKQSSATLYVLFALPFAAATVCCVMCFFVPVRPSYLLMLCVAASLFVLLAFRALRLILPDSAVPVMRTAAALMSLIYLALICYLLFFSSYYERVPPREGANYLENLTTHFHSTFNLEFGRNYRIIIEGYHNKKLSLNYVIRNFAGNSVVFMPFALYLPLLFKSTRKWYVFLPAVVAAILTAELLQLFTLTGWCDIDDLLLNTVGAALAYFILRIPPLRRAVSAVFKLEY